jgi:hypothetical protein
VEHSSKVHVDETVPVGEGELLGLPSGADSGVVEHQIEPPVNGVHAPDQLGDLIAIADIEQDTSRGTWARGGQLLRDTLGGLMLDVSEHDLMTANNQSTTDGRTDPRGTSCDDGDATHPSPLPWAAVHHRPSG